MYLKDINCGEILTNKDDIYNLSVRKKAASVCQSIINDINDLEQCYNELDDKTAEDFIINNKQILNMCKKIFKTLNIKKQPLTQKYEHSKSDIMLYISALLSRIAESVISLSNIISIRHIERELIFASEIILRQLIYILPYKIQ